MVEDATGLARAPYPFTLPSGHAPAGTGLPTSIVFAISQASCRMWQNSCLSSSSPEVFVGLL